MKKIGILIGLLMIVCSLQAQKEVKSKLVKVTVYPNTALVEKSTRINLVKGENKFVITDNATTFNRDNLHFAQNEDFFITSVNLKDINKSFNQACKDNFLPNIATQIINLNDKVQQNKQKIADNNLLISTYRQQLSALTNLKAVKNTQAIDTIKTLKEQFEFQKDESIKLNNLIVKVQKENKELNFQLSKMDEELENLIKQNNGNCNLTTNSKNIIISIYSNRNMTAELQYDYLVSNVSSNYAYDVMLDENLQNAIFNLKANITQWTNENWKDCNIVFSTNEAKMVGEDGELYTWYLNNQPIYREYTKGRSTKKAMNSNVMMAKSVQVDGVLQEMDSESEDALNEVVYIESGATSENFTLSKEYTLNIRQSISSGDKVQTIPLVFDTTKAEFKHFSTPKNIEKVYYTALLPDWEDLQLLDVNCDIFLNGKYIAKSYISTNSTRDTMKFSAGEDNGVKISRKMRKSSPDKGFLSSNVETTVTVTLNIKNTKDKVVDLEIKDQIPISQDANIKITNVENLEGALNSSTGIIKWNLQLQPKQTKELKFSYTVKFPKDYNLNLN